MMNENDISKIIVDCAYNIHVEIGPGLLESVYELILYDRIMKTGLQIKKHCPIKVHYEGREFNKGFIADLIVEDKVIIELKSKEHIHPADKMQLLTYLRMSNLKLGLLINFGEYRIKDGIKRIINGKII
jgi:GxxExxY protein